MMGPMDSLTLTPGPVGVEKAVWARNRVPNRTFQLPCTGELLQNRDGVNDDSSPFTCGTYPRRSVIKHFLRKTYGGTDRYNDGARQSVVREVQALVNRTLMAWSIDQNFLCTCRDGVTTGWNCCIDQQDCATTPCPCPGGGMSVACCSSVCQGLNGNGLMQPFSSIPGSNLSKDLLSQMGAYLRNDVWVSNDPWLLFDPNGKQTYSDSWNQSRYQVEDAGLFDASKPVVYYDEITHPFKSTFWEHCTGLLQQVIWTMPMNRKNDKPKGMGSAYDPVNGVSTTINLTYTEDFIQSLTLEAYKSSPIYWHYNVRHAPSQSEVCKRTTPRPPLASASFRMGQNNTARRFGFSAMTLGGVGGADCYCGWWDTATTCRIPDATCTALVQILGFSRICVTQRQIYNASDHLTVLSALEALLVKQPRTMISCPMLQISEHWGFIDHSNGLPWADANSVLLNEGAGGFRLGNVDWLFATQMQILNAKTRVEMVETTSASAALQCSASSNPALADHFVDELFPAAQGVRQSMPQSYCTRYGIELARMAVYTAANLADATGQQQAVVNKWRMRCQYKLEELAICNSFKVYNATGGPTDASQCPFSLAVSQSIRSSYAVTPGCLVVLWNTNGQDGIYDPCICVSCNNTPVIDLPTTLTTLCLMAPFQSLVAKDVIPGESSTGVPLGSGSFESLMRKPGTTMQINALQDISHWALHTSIRDADLVADWWPDEWKQPVGHHVTAGCSRPGDAHWKTFDASWRWDSRTEQMVFAKDETNDPLLSRDAFGASGVCRANNYGMPMTGLNTMTTCTKENENAKADPTVPLQSTQPTWADGIENCAPDAFATPWNVDRMLNPPRQWTVGTLQRDVLTPLTAAEWGASCGPYPLRTCATNGDCATGLVCIFTNGAGVCGKKQTGKFECTNHIQCENDRLCAGDGVCVDGVWQIANELPTPISFRTYAQKCATGTPLDTWGTSVAEQIPDILSSSGLCSYRSWFENRRMADRNFCNNSDTCPAVEGSRPWNFSSPYLQDRAGESAFDSGVLQVKAHPCDRDYQYLQGFVSCTPKDASVKMYDPSGNALEGYVARKDKRTQTYKTGFTLPVLHHADEIQGPTFGFTGVPKTYEELRLGQPNPYIVACSEERVCGLQPINSFKVNSFAVDARLVLASGAVRIYGIGDLLACGVFGYVTSSGQCRLDYAIVPLAYIVLNNNMLQAAKASARGLADTYVPGGKQTMLSVLQGLPELIINTYIGGRPSTLQDYVAMSAKFVLLYEAFKQIDAPKYDTAGTPMQLYNLTLFGALEVPFAWWYKCAWLKNIPMGSQIVDGVQCSWDSPGNPAQPTGFGPVDKPLADLFGGLISQKSDPGSKFLIDKLVKLPGIVTQSILDQAKTDYVSNRSLWIDQLNRAVLDKIWRSCFQEKKYIQDYSDRSEEYQLARLRQTNGQFTFDSTRPYTDDSTKVTLCSGLECLQSTGYARLLAYANTFAPKITEKMRSIDVTSNDPDIKRTSVMDIQDKLALSSLFSTAQLTDQFWSDLTTSPLFQNLPGGCSVPVTRLNTNESSLECICTVKSNCGAQIVNTVLEVAGVTDKPNSTEKAKLALDTTELDICNTLRASAEGTCYLNDGGIASQVYFPKVHEVKVPVGAVAEFYQEEPWKCVELTCTGTGAYMSGKKAPMGYVPTPNVKNERLVMDVYDYNQIFAKNRVNAWKSIEEQINDMACSDNTHRYDSKEMTSEWYSFLDPLNVYHSTQYRCVPSCNIPDRGATRLVSYRLRTMNMSYFVNDALVAQVEMYPCLQGPQASLDSEAKIAQASIDLQTASDNMDAFRDEKIPTLLRACRDIFHPETGLPDPAYLYASYLRKFNSKRISALDQNTQDKLADIRQVISTLYNQNSDAMCLQNALTLTDTLRDVTRLTCASSDAKSQGSVSIDIWSSFSAINSAKRRNYCASLKADSFFGCIMYPGEQTIHTTGYYFNDPNNAFEAACSSTVLAYSSCMKDDATDTCKSVPDPSSFVSRDMKLTGATLTFSLKTIAPDCTLSSARDCFLMDEIANMASTNNLSFCPGKNASTQRFQLSANLYGNPTTRPNTGIKYPIESSTASQRTYTSSFGFSHLFLGLDADYQCCQGCTDGQPPAQFCIGPRQMPVQMRSNLWRCLECPLVSSVQCKGIHNCLMSSPKLSSQILAALEKWNALTPQQQAFLTNTDSPIDVVVPAVRWLIETVSARWIPDVRLSYIMPSFMTSFNQQSAQYVYNPLPLAQYDAAMQINAQSCQAEGLMPDFTNCSYDSHRRNLRQFANSNYKVDEGVVLESRQTMQWKVGQSQLTSQNIPQWEANFSGRSGLFVTDLLDDKWCLRGGMVGSACYRWLDSKGVKRLEVLNPSLLGAFEPSIGCDTAIVNQQRVVSAVCANCGNSYVNEYNTAENGYIIPCGRTSDAVPRVTVDNAAATNLCSKTPQFETTCTNQHGMLGQTGYDGSPTSNVHTRNPWGGGLPSGLNVNPLFLGGAAPAGISNLALSPNDIGGHFIRMAVSQTKSGAYTMSIRGLPLSSYPDPLGPIAYALGTAGYDMTWTRINAAKEASTMEKLYPPSTCGAWDCPLRRRAFWMGANADFMPLVPDPLRTQILYGTRAHPTQRAFPMPTVLSQGTSSVLGRYSTYNGFCACMSPPCTGCTADTDALMGTWTLSSVLPQTPKCTEQLDWPYAGGTLRDGSTLNQRWSTTVPCGVLDRLPVFQYRYKDSRTTRPTTKTTLDKGGVCHMGWPVVSAGPLAGCYLLVETDTYMCPSFARPKNVIRLRAKTIAELLNTPSRARLSDCSAPPTYKLANNATTPPEVSYGQLKRRETSRMLANDLRRRLCGNSTVCKPSSNWSLSTFWDTVYMKTFPRIPQGNGANESLWSKPWVACNQSADGVQFCQGTIDRNTWATGNRQQVCLDTILAQPISKSLAQDMDVCNLDSSLDAFCRAVQNSRYRVFEANCQYSGQCREKLFFYQPSTYHVDNSEFVRSTVQTFYNSTVTGACIPDQDTAAQILANAQNLDKCAAVSLNVLVRCIQVVRVVVDSFVELSVYAAEIILNVLQLLGPLTDDQKNEVGTQISALFVLITNKFNLIFQEIGDLVYEIFQQGPFGSWIIGLVEAICAFVEWLFTDVVFVVLCWAKQVILFVLGYLADGFVAILNGLSFGKLGYLHDDIGKAMDAVRKNIPCEPLTLWSCSISKNKRNNTNPTLPLPTRCWAGVEPGVSSLACTAADTCIQLGDMTKVVCGACPVASSMTRFGCDTLTKLCTCNVFPVGISACTSHQDCTLDDQDVSCRYVDSYLQPSYGNVPCTRCQKPICLITSGTVGQCSCLLRPVSLQTCSTVGMAVSPDASALCLVASDGSSQLASSNAYTVNYGTLLSAPCMLLNQAQIFCMAVYTSASVATPLVVGLSILHTRRRSLLWDQGVTNGSVFLSSNSSEWDLHGEPCRSLALANASSLGILEKYTLGECWRWYEIGSRLVTSANMSYAVSPFFLVSWRDLLDTILNRGALVEITAKLPEITHHVLLHSEYAQPVYLMLAYWTSMLPRELWTNQSFLDQASAMLHNASASHSRRILQFDEDGKKAARRDLLAANTVIDTQVSSQTVYEWSQGPYSWPPNFMYWNGDGSCAVASTILDVVKNGLRVTFRFYTESPPKPRPVEWPQLPLHFNPIDLNASLIDLSSIDGVAKTTTDLMSTVAHALVNSSQIKTFVEEASYMKLVDSLVLCNFTRVQTCSDRRSLFWSVVQSVCVITLVIVAARLLQIPYIEVLLLICTVPIFLFVAYGYTPQCLPMVPSCLLRDLLEIVDWLLPASIQWPPALVTSPGCTSVQCMRSCTADPVLGFANYNEHIAWSMCEADNQWAINTAMGMPSDSPIRMAILRKCVIPDMRQAQRICFAVTLVNSAPLLILVVIALWLLPSLLTIALAAIRCAVEALVYLFIFAHTGD